ncbi:MAG: hypothetical protein AAFO07_13645 [Bacteroidota bacterium]
MRLIIMLMLISAVAFGNSDKRISELQKDMLAFDQAYIPLWYQLRSGDIIKAKKQVLYVNFKWQQVRKKYEFAVADIEWTDRFCKANEWLNDAFTSIDFNRPKIAAVQLNHVRYELAALRSHFNIDYPLDAIFNIQEQAEAVLEVVQDDKLCLLEWNELELMVARLNDDWFAFQSKRYDPILFDLNLKDRALMKKYREDIALHLIQVNHAIKGAQQLEMMECVIPLAKTTTALLKLFGEFDAFQTHTAGMLPESWMD